MPASRQRSRSPFIALAVMAMIGVCRFPVSRSFSRITLVASNPSISGICTSIRTTSNDCLLQCRDGLVSVVGNDHFMPFHSQQSKGHLLVDQTILGEQDIQPAFCIGRLIRRCAGKHFIDDAGTNHIQDCLEQIGLHDWLGQVTLDP